MTIENREKGGFFSIGDSNSRPWCFRDQPLLEEILNAVEPTTTSPQISREVTEVQQRNQAAMAATKRERDCPLWMSYKPGLGPSTHLGGLAMLEVEQRREEFEQRMDRDRRDFDLKILEMNQKLQRDSAHVGYWLAAGAVVFAILQVLAAILASTPDSLLREWLRRETPTQIGVQSTPDSNAQSPSPTVAP